MAAFLKRKKDKAMNVRFGLRMKFTLLFAALMLVIISAITIILYEGYETLLFNKYVDYADSVAYMVTEMVDEEKLQDYVHMEEDDETYKSVVEQMKNLQEGARFAYLYVVVIEDREEGAGTYYFDLKLQNGKSAVYHERGEYSDLHENYPKLEEMLEQGEDNKKFDESEDGDHVKLYSVYAPIRKNNDEDGELIAFVGIDYEQEKLKKEIHRNIWKNKTMLLIPMLMAISFPVIIIIIQVSILHPVYRLKKYADQVADGHFDNEVKVRGHDELSEILRVFQRMSERIAGNMSEMQILNEAYYRYVPSMILTLLGKDSILDVQPGNEASAMLSVFSFQLADFDRNIRKKSAKEMMEAINLILQVSVPVMAKQEGMIESFQNAGFTALFKENCDGALLSGVTICQKLNQLAAAGLIEKPKAGIGIAYGRVTLGVVGEKSRLAAITVSQYRDMACWLQTIAERYQSHILVTQETADDITGFFESYHTRMLGFLYNTYTGYTGRIYDVYDGDDREEFALKDATKELFEEGVEFYCLREFKKARQNFIKVLKVFRRDRAAKEYLYLCDKNCMEKHPEKIDVYFTRME